ncbi:YhgE/Pip family protein [Nonomuraea sp. NPDC050328]|uniref:YhgE/Pip family protein n=1 Tax=Nonomuraea sp. NPDC050328 TaxID=3364361 RepID=UPI0037B50DC7
MRELRRFTRARITRLALAAVVLLPLLYAGLYLWSFWDPQDHLDRLPVALVTEDTGKYGKELAEELREREVLGWHEVSARQAADGVRDGSFYLSLTIPADFSSRLESPSTDRAVPASLGVTVDTGRSYIMGSISDAVFNEVRAAAARTAIQGYFDEVFISIGDIHDKTVEAADGARKLQDGTVKAGEGAGRLQVGLASASSATAQLSSGVNKLQNGAGQLTSGLSTLQDKLGELEQGVNKLRREGTGALAAGTSQAYEQVHAQRGKVNQLADKYVPVLNEYGPQVAESAEQVAELADRLAAGLDGLAAEAGGSAQEAAQSARAALDGLGPETDPQVRSLLRDAANSAERAAAKAARLEERLSGSGDLPAAARDLARQARRIAAVAPELGPKLDGLREQYNTLDDGLGKLAEGAATVHGKVGEVGAAAGKLEAGAGKVVAGAAKLAGGLDQLGDGVGKLSGGLGKLGDGASSLDKGLDKLAGGSKELAEGLGDGAGQIPDYDQAERDSRTETMSDPVRLAKSVRNEVPNYGTGFAPFFVPLALWVGAMIAYMVLRPLNPRLLAGTAGALRVALAGWAPAVALGFAQVGVLVAVLKFALGLEAAHWWGVVGILLLATAAFLALVQAVNALLGPPGRVAALALLMLQLTSAAGTYPIETSPGFFQTISPWLPMSWLVAALRRLISGGELTVVWQACGVLSAFLALGLALTVLAVHKGRTWSLKRLHPELAL